MYLHKDDTENGDFVIKLAIQHKDHWLGTNANKDCYVPQRPLNYDILWRNFETKPTNQLCHQCMYFTPGISDFSLCAAKSFIPSSSSPDIWHILCSTITPLQAVPLLPFSSPLLPLDPACFLPGPRAYFLFVLAQGATCPERPTAW